MEVIEEEKSEFEPTLVSFRDLVPEITDTGYLTHSIYYYPAKFIPHVVKYCIENFTKQDDWVIDPFAGSGTVGLEAFIHERNAVLYDLNLLLNHIIPVKIYKENGKHSKSELYKVLNGFDSNKKRFIPSWENVEYWYPEEMLEELSKYWGYLKTFDKNIYSMVIQAALVKVSKHFSYAEHRTPKLFRSKSKKEYVEELLREDWKDELKRMVYSLSLQFYDSVCHLQFLTNGHENKVLHYGGVDSAYFQLNENIPISCLITSPPYLQAQEYIRTAKLELYWLGHSEEEIKGISKLEIPYRKADQVFETQTLKEIKSKLERKDLIATLDSYFCYTIKSLERAMGYLIKDGKVCIFVGNPTIDGKEVETWKILMEYFCERGYNFENVFDDRIKTRQLFGSRNNKNPEGMKSEYLLVLSKHG
ncbi:site-specific DNA-methyltransferase [Candidatus Woesearchaeota archaeon]|nr:site-specific DNA-methyltransferase [Candidatus Woesearchaeota archaeon]